jgi:hypothetical protein
MTHSKRVAQTAHKEGNLCAIPLKKIKFKVKNQEATNNHKNYQRTISK